MEHLTGAGYAGLALSAVAIGLGFVLLVSQHMTRASLSISLCYVFLGLTLLAAIPLIDQVDPDDPAWWTRFAGIFPAGIMVFSSWYLLALLDTAVVAPRQVRRVRAIIRYVGYGLGAGLAVLSFLFPAESLNDFVMSIDEPGFFSSTAFLVFAPYYLLGGILFGAAWVYVARLRLDVGEKVRAVVAGVTSSLLTIIAVLPMPAAMALFAFVIVLGTYGQFRYSTAQGERAAFLSRFLSSQVTESVRVDGLESVMQPGERDVTVVACDLRGFTAYAEAVPSQAVIDLLSEYYDAVGDAVSEIGGTVKDYAGDGVLMIIGAPIPRADHAAAGLRLAGLLHVMIQPVLVHWATGPHPLGVGVGVASGHVTVGAVGSSSRMEYTAVGTAVNVAARLCAHAGDGETLVDQATVDLAGGTGLSPRGEMQIKGLSVGHMIYALEPRDDGSLSPAPGSTTS